MIIHADEHDGRANLKGFPFSTIICSSQICRIVHAAWIGYIAALRMINHGHALSKASPAERAFSWYMVASWQLTRPEKLDAFLAHAT